MTLSITRRTRAALRGVPRPVARLALLASLTVAAEAGAQSAAYSPIVLRLPAGPRTLAMGNTGIVSRDDEAIFFNPAQLVTATGFGVSGERLSATAGTGAVSAVTRFGGGGVGIGMRFASYRTPGGVFPTSRASMLADFGAPGTSLEATAGIARTFKGFRVGVAGKYAEELTGGARVASPAADVGVSRDVMRVNVGLAVQNIGADQDVGAIETLMPLRTTLGVGHTRSLGPFDFAVTGAVSLLRDDFVQPSGGVEMNYSWLSGYNVALRAGGRRPALGEDGFTAGAGFTRDRVNIDYAAEMLRDGRFGHRLGLRIR
jgi:hypothetical protein